MYIMLMLLHQTDSSWLCALLDRCSSQLPPLLLQSQLPHSEPKQTSIAPHSQQPWTHHQGESQLWLIKAMMFIYLMYIHASELWLYVMTKPLLHLSYCSIFPLLRPPITSCSAAWKIWRGKDEAFLGLKWMLLYLQTGNTTNPEKFQVCFIFVALQNLDRGERGKGVNYYSHDNEYFMVHYNLNQRKCNFSTLYYT